MLQVARIGPHGLMRRLLSALLAVVMLAPAAADTPLTLGVFPRHSAALTEAMFAPLAAYLTRAVGQEVRLETTQDFLTFWERVEAGRYDIVHYNQYHYLRSHRDSGYRVIAMIEEFGKSDIAGALVVRKDSGFDTITDLKGRKIIFGGGEQAMVSYIMTRYLLAQAGLNDGDYISQFALNPPKACVAVYYRQGAAAGVGDVVLEMPAVREQIDTDEMKVLARTQAIAGLPWAVRASLPEHLATRIQAALIGLAGNDDGKRILAITQLTGFKAASDDDYREHRRIIEQVTGEKF